MVWLAAAMLAAGGGPGPERLAVSGDFDAPPGRVVRLFSEIERYPHIFAAITRAEIRSRTGNRSVAFVEVAFPWPIGPRWLLAETNAEQDRVTWRRLDGTVRRYEASLHVAELPGGRTRATYDAVVDAGWSATPGWLSSLLQGHVMNQILADAKRYVRQYARVSTQSK